MVVIDIAVCLRLGTSWESPTNEVTTAKSNLGVDPSLNCWHFSILLGPDRGVSNDTAADLHIQRMMPHLKGARTI